MKVLLTNAWMKNFGGSELVTLELGEEFQRQGHEVLIYSPNIGGLGDSVPMTDKKPSASSFDLVWIHHNQLIHDLGFKKRTSQRIVFNHMSSYVSTEFPKIAGYENAIADLKLANSYETALRLEALGLTDVKLFQNPAPINFEVSGMGEGGLIVSNHVMSQFDELGLKRIGLHNPKRVTPEMLSNYKFVVCNGKTVQYALRAGLCVYLYDHFGGCGWLTKDTFGTAELYNFSGRGFGQMTQFSIGGDLYEAPMMKKTTEQIMTELETIPEPMPCPDRFKLEIRLRELLC